jgi:hypothetical protein
MVVVVVVYQISIFKIAQTLLMELNSSNNVLISVPFLIERPIIIGINVNGDFVVSFTGNNFSHINNENLVYMLRLFEIEYSSFCKKIQSMISEFNLRMKSTNATLSNFPFVELTKSALSSERDYWIELSIPWILHIGKDLFKKEIQDLSKNKNLSQKLRHELLRL